MFTGDIIVLTSPPIVPFGKRWSNVTVTATSALKSSDALSVQYPAGVSFVGNALPLDSGDGSACTPLSPSSWSCPSARSIAVRVAAGLTTNPASVTVGTSTCSGSNTCQLRDSGGGSGASGTPSGYVNLGGIGVQPVWFVILISLLAGIFLFGIVFAIYRRGPCFSRSEEEGEVQRGFWRRKRGSDGRDLEIMQAMRGRKDPEEGATAPFSPGTILGDRLVGEGNTTSHHNRPGEQAMSRLGRAPGTLLGSISTGVKDHHIETRDTLSPPIIGAPGTLLGNLTLTRDGSKQSSTNHAHNVGSLPRSLDRRSRKSNRSNRPESDSDEDRHSGTHGHHAAHHSRKMSVGSAYLGGGDLGSGFISKTPDGFAGSLVNDFAHDEVRNLTMKSHRSRNSENQSRRMSSGSAPQDCNKDAPFSASVAYADAITTATSSFDRVGAWVSSLDRRKPASAPMEDELLPPLHPTSSNTSTSKRPSQNSTTPQNSHLQSSTLQHKRSNPNIRGYSPSGNPSSNSAPLNPVHRRPSRSGGERPHAHTSSIGVVHAAPNSITSSSNTMGKRADSNPRRSSRGLRTFDEEEHQHGFDHLQRDFGGDDDGDEVPPGVARRKGRGESDGALADADSDDEQPLYKNASLPRGRKKSARSPSASSGNRSLGIGRPPSPSHDVEVAAGYVTSTSNASTAVARAHTTSKSKRMVLSPDEDEPPEITHSVSKRSSRGNLSSSLPSSAPLTSTRGPRLSDAGPPTTDVLLPGSSKTGSLPRNARSRVVGDVAAPRLSLEEVSERTLGSSARRARTTTTRHKEGRKKEAVVDGGDEDDGKPLASIALASLQKSIGGGK
ncbi:hypothetical protein BC829DRAFT_439471 [Chytridium lagenaria]|nr:hypothetical protein BC829DRAFT_439471 [Chytridium lagenaria]